MTLESMWLEYVGSLDEEGRYDLSHKYLTTWGEVADLHRTDVMEYVLLLETGEVAQMPEVPAWV